MDTALAWDPEALQQRLQSSTPGLRVQVLAAVDSTNTRLLEAARHGDRGPRLLVAEAQHQGRGRNGRAWQSAPGTSLTFSLALAYAPADWSGLSLAVGVALAEAIDPRSDDQRPRLLLKWPNDLWLADAAAAAGGRKLGGILIETVGVAAGDRVAVIGIGLNVLPRDDAAALSSGYACARELDATLDAPALLARVAPPLLRALRRFETTGLASFAAGFARRDLLHGRSVSTSLADLPLGTAAGIDEQGALRLQTANGERRVSSGEVSVRPVDGPER